MLSVVQIIGRQRTRAENGLQKLLGQKVSAPLEIILVDIEPTAPALPSSADPRVRVVPRPGLRDYAAAMAAGASEATGDYVAFIEDHCHAQPGWAAAVVRDFERPVAMVNYSFMDTEPGSYLSRSFLMAEYGRWIHPTRPGPLPIASCANISYRRDILMRLAKERPLEEWFQAEYILHRRIQSDGGVIWQSTDAVAAHEDWVTLSGGLFANGALKRYHAAAVAFGNPRWSLLRRCAYAAGMLVVPGLQMWRLLRSIIPRPRHWGHFISALPVSLAVYTYAAAAEAVGYLMGPGDSGEQFVVVELELARK